MFAEHRVKTSGGSSELQWVGNKLHVVITDRHDSTHPRWTGWEIVQSEKVGL